jgi:hypothetical protein
MKAKIARFLSVACIGWALQEACYDLKSGYPALPAFSL